MAPLSAFVLVLLLGSSDAFMVRHIATQSAVAVRQETASCAPRRRRRPSCSTVLGAAAAGAGAARANNAAAPTRRLLKPKPAGGKSGGASSSPSSSSRSAPREPSTAAAAAAAPTADGGGGSSSSADDSTLLLAVNEEFRAAMKEFRKADASRKLLRYVEERANTTSLDQFMAVYAFRTLQRMNRNDLCVDMIPLWHRALKASGAGGAVDVDSAAALLRACCKLQRMDLAEGIATRAGVVLEQLRTEDGISIGSGSSGGSGSSSSSGGGEGAGAGSDTTTAPGSDETPLISDGQRHAYGRFLPELALGYASAGSHPKALSALRMMRKFHVPIDADLSKQIFKGFLRESGGPEVRQCLRALLSVGGLGDNDSIQLLTSTYMKTVDFVKGAVSMETLPPATCPEAAFIGRSNVGKSSLINMLSNRKGLAFTSKTPGKTSEFNYFDAQGRLAATNEKHRFYLVDLPGVGYAEVQRELKDSWLRLLKSYVVGRPTLRVLFHLIDSRHGLLDADDDCLSLLDGLPDHVQYVLVLTKVDKRGGGVRQDILDRVAAAVRARTSRPVPIVHTSSETREGGAEMWSILVDAVAGEPSANFFSNKYV